MPTRSIDLGGRAVVLVSSVLLAGCPSLGLHQGTKPVPNGRYQLGAAAGGAVFYDAPEELRTVLPSVEVSVRRGVSDDADVQLKLHSLGLDVGAKYRVLDGDWSMAVLPMVGASRSPETAMTSNGLYLWGHLSTIVGRRITPTTQVHFGPRMLYGMFVPSAGGTAQGLSMGGFVNAELPLSRGVRCVPELGVFGTLGGDVPVRGVSAYVAPGLLFDL